MLFPDRPAFFYPDSEGERLNLQKLTMEFSKHLIPFLHVCCYSKKRFHNCRIKVRAGFLPDDCIRLFKGHGIFITAFGNQCIKNIRHCHNSCTERYFFPADAIGTDTLRFPVPTAQRNTAGQALSGQEAH